MKTFFSSINPLKILAAACDAEEWNRVHTSNRSAKMFWPFFRYGFIAILFAASALWLVMAIQSALVAIVLGVVATIVLIVGLVMMILGLSFLADNRHVDELEIIGRFESLQY